MLAVMATNPRSEGSKMDSLSIAYAQRARSALDSMIEHSAPNFAAQQAKAFAAIGLTLLKHGRHAYSHLESHPDPLVQKAAASVLGVWEGDAAQLASAYLESVAELSILDQLLRYGLSLPPYIMNPLVASGFSADVVAEAGVKVVKDPAIQQLDGEPLKVAAIVAMSDELARVSGEAGLRLFSRELTKAVTRGSNAAVLAALPATTTIPGTGDPLADLQAGLLAAGPSEGYVVAAPAGAVAALAVSTANRAAMGVRGGALVTGIDLVAIDDADSMTIIPASNVAIRDFGLELRASNEAAIDLRDNPTGPSQLVSLFQSNTRAILAERSFLIAAGDAVIVEVGGS